MSAAWRAPRLLVALALVLPVLGATGLTAPPAQAGGPADRLPDLRMQPLSGVHVTVENGRRLLRFTAIMSNWGVGHFEIHATRPSTSAGWSVAQVVFNDQGGSREVATAATLKYAGDGHDHWHVRDMMNYDLWGPSGTYREAKIGFCFLDTTAVNLGLPGARQSPYYRAQACDGIAKTNIRTGISIGWGDSYPWNFAYQWVDITGIAAGTYTLRSVVDPRGLFLETNESNNCTWLRLSIPASGSATVLGSGSTCVDDIASSTFANDIAWLYDQGLTDGCRPLLFCTNDPVTRGQMAAFLARAMNLPATATDYFTDDDGGTFENDINKIAAAGITVGCAPSAYCPDDPVRRDQMASFLVRALGLPPSGTDAFTDDDGNTHEKPINDLAAAGITSGCGPGLYCPAESVTRGQMAAFLHRAFG